jgi:hypothetical protein
VSEDLEPRPEAHPGGEPSVDRRLRRAAELDLDLPPFDGPLVAFDPAPWRGAGDPIYLGGDLHAVHPRSLDRRSDRPRDDTLDGATITLTLGDFVDDMVETTAVEGVWCVGLHDDLLESSMFLMIRDDDGRLRAWLLLPPPGSMLGEGGLWLPSIAPFTSAG